MGGEVLSDPYVTIVIRFFYFISGLLEKEKNRNSLLTLEVLILKGLLTPFDLWM